MPDLERELLYRLLETDECTDTVRTGEVPPGFPVSLSSRVRLLGSREQSFPQSPDAAGLSFRRSNHVRVLLDSALPVADFIAQMRDSLGNDWETSGWPPTPHQGFLPAEAQDTLSVYSLALEKMLNVRAAGAVETTRVTLDLYDQSAADRARMQHFEQPQQPTLVPVRIPAGATLYPGGGSSGSTHASCEAGIESDLSADELLDFFGAQLAQRSWHLLTRTQTETTTAISWTDRRGALVFIALETASQGHRASMIVTRPVGSGSGRASSSYTING